MDGFSDRGSTPLRSTKKGITSLLVVPFLCGPGENRDILQLMPLSFREFLMAVGEEGLAELY